MKTLLTAAAILALLTGVDSAQAQDRHDHDWRDGGPPRGAPPQGGPPQGGPPPGAARPGPAYTPGPAPRPPVTQPPRPVQPQYNPAPNGGQRGPGGYQGGGPGGYPGARPQGDRQGPPAYRHDRPDGDRGGDRDWGRDRGRPGWGAPGFQPGGRDRPHYDPRYYPRVMDLGQRYHWFGGGWRPQRGFYYHRWIYGEFLPFGWYDQSYWVGNYWDYGLPVPPFGYNWVRVGDDVLLINLQTGFVAEVIYGVFY